MERLTHVTGGGLGWIHDGERQGTEVAVVAHRARRGPEAFELTGSLAAVEGGQPFALRYRLVLDLAGRTRYAVLRRDDAEGSLRTVVAGDGHGRWTVDGVAASRLDGCLDVDLEASLLTNAFPVARLPMPLGEQADVPAVWVRAGDLRAEVLQQRYTRLTSPELHGPRFAYEAPEHEFSCELQFGTDGFVLDYPGLGRRSPQAPPSSASPLLAIAAPSAS